MIFDEQDLVKTFNKADNFTAIGAVVLGQTVLQRRWLELA